ncbi:MAG: protein translocase subunit SecF [Candidatus Delongbacteria bacterium]|nr:protein translocase subunit SecF [Candidatus Delongbacteria bacterium]
MQLHFFKDANYEFIRNYKYALMMSAGLILIGIVMFIAHGGFKMSIDFAGGTIVQVKFNQPIDLKTLRSDIGILNLSSLEISKFGEEDEVLIRFFKGEQQQTGTEKILSDFFAAQYPSNPAEIRRVEEVGPKIGEELKVQAFYAILFSLIGILIYVTFRFEFKFAVAAIIALFHDVFCTLSIFALFDKEISIPVIAALLTIVGYSINDTIVIFDRIRENMRVIRKQSYDRIFNISINQTLSRTIITSGTTLLACLSLVIWGSEVTFDFSFALLFGVMVGTYSSVFVATPIVVMWHDYSEKREHQQKTAIAGAAARK